MVTVILAEKPSQKKDYVNAFKTNKNKSGYSIVEDNELIQDDEIYITSGFGHLIELEEPSHYDSKFKKWNLEDLPIIPKEFKYKVTEDAGIKKQFKIVKSLIDKADTICIATDIDREGELIARLIINKCNPKKTAKYKRLVINSTEKEVVRQGFKNLQNADDRYYSYIEALTRQQSDWLIGINLTRYYTSKINDKTVYSVGRVQTATLSLVKDRCDKIDHFKPESYYVLTANNENYGTFKNNEKFNKEELKAFLQKHRISKNVKGTITNVETKTKNNSSPNLFNLSDLQQKANKELKISPTESLEIIQKLYENKYVTYPRTSCNYITDSEFSYLKSNIENYSKYLNVEHLKFNSLDPRKKYVNSEKVEEHYAIIPTKTIPNKDKLNETEKWFYDNIVKQTLGMFMEDYSYEETTVSLDINEVEFYQKAKVINKTGFKELITDKEEKSNVIPNVEKGEHLELLIEPVVKTTQPPKHFTEGTLLKAMINAGNADSIEDDEDRETLKEVEGIGTEATRANTIETLFNQKYIEKKKGKIFITDKGNRLCEAVNGTPLRSPKMTAEWEKYLKKIGKQEGKKDIFMKNIENLITKIIS
ncbi:DNA topoisomerase III [Staphylococcus aureus]|uniref:DNA topoisomerase III n=3 Tax=Staphylococcus aureus TaxID=1280 RepID=UPI000DE20E3E|nr:DNA topoisomerase III [Staphylococcus aureus]